MKSHHIPPQPRISAWCSSAISPLRLSMAERRFGRPRSHSISGPAVPGGRLKPGFDHPVPWFFPIKSNVLLNVSPIKSNVLLNFSHQIQCFEFFPSNPMFCWMFLPHQNQVGSKRFLFSSLLGWCTGNLQQTICFLQTIGFLQVFPAKIWMILCIYV